MKNITKVILEIKKYFVKNICPAEEINCGHCDEFAQAVIMDMGGCSENLSDEVTEGFPYLPQTIGQYWISYNGKHYDSDSPFGVNYPSQLSIFLKNSLWW